MLRTLACTELTPLERIFSGSTVSASAMRAKPRSPAGSMVQYLAAAQPNWPAAPKFLRPSASRSLRPVISASTPTSARAFWHGRKIALEIHPLATGGIFYKGKIKIARVVYTAPPPVMRSPPAVFCS